MSHSLVVVRRVHGYVQQNSRRPCKHGRLKAGHAMPVDGLWSGPMSAGMRPELKQAHLGKLLFGRQKETTDPGTFVGSNTPRRELLHETPSADQRWEGGITPGRAILALERCTCTLLGQRVSAPGVLLLLVRGLEGIAVFTLQTAPRQNEFSAGPTRAGCSESCVSTSYALFPHGQSSLTSASPWSEQSDVSIPMLALGPLSESPALAGWEDSRLAWSEPVRGELFRRWEGARRVACNGVAR
eukprot:357058-Chlamydomonas_euryale.AAC.3